MPTLNLTLILTLTLIPTLTLTPILNPEPYNLTLTITARKCVWVWASVIARVEG